jgi:hypothetical protein
MWVLSLNVREWKSGCFDYYCLVRKWFLGVLSEQELFDILTVMLGKIWVLEVLTVRYILRKNMFCLDYGD